MNSPCNLPTLNLPISKEAIEKPHQAVAQGLEHAVSVMHIFPGELGSVRLGLGRINKSPARHWNINCQATAPHPASRFLSLCTGLAIKTETHLGVISSNVSIPKSRALQPKKYSARPTAKKSLLKMTIIVAVRERQRLPQGEA